VFGAGLLVHGRPQFGTLPFLIIGYARVHLIPCETNKLTCDPSTCSYETAKAELKGLMPEDAKEAIGHGVRAKRSRSGAVSFDLLDQEASHAPLQ
jgi:hypothetical protein